MQHTTEVDETFGTYNCNMCVKHMQHPDEMLANCNIKTLIANIRLKQMKHFEHTFAT
jgi:hypothetical protein